MGTGCELPRLARVYVVFKLLLDAIPLTGGMLEYGNLTAACESVGACEPYLSWRKSKAGEPVEGKVRYDGRARHGMWTGEGHVYRTRGFFPASIIEHVVQCSVIAQYSYYAIFY